MNKTPMPRKARNEEPEAAADDGLGELSIAWHAGGPNFLSTRINFLAKLVDRHTAHMLNDGFGITVAQWRVLSELNRSGPLTIRALSERSWVDRAEASRAAAALVGRGLVTRNENPNNLKMPTFTATPAGLAFYRKIKPSRDAFQTVLAEAMSGEELKLLQDILQRMARRLIALQQKNAKDGKALRDKDSKDKKPSPRDGHAKR